LGTQNAPELGLPSLQDCATSISESEYIRRIDLSGRPLAYTFEEDSPGPFGEDAPGPWYTYRQACVRYRWIFFLYWLFGVDGLIFKTSVGRRLYKKLIGKPRWEFPGWYDTHAKKELAP
jgi:hypothetical protein